MPNPNLNLAAIGLDKTQQAAAAGPVQARGSWLCQKGWGWRLLDSLKGCMPRLVVLLVLSQMEALPASQLACMHRCAACHPWCLSRLQLSITIPIFSKLLLRRSSVVMLWM